jgi:hypothetical protein
MVLDAKALNWAGKNNIDTAKLKAAKVPIYGKWYFPEIPPNLPLVNLETGEQTMFDERMIAGEVIYVPAADLQRAGLAPEGFTVMHVPAPGEGPGRALRRAAPEPLVAMARPPGLPRSTALVSTDSEAVAAGEDTPDVSGIHMPSASISPFVLGIGFCIVFFGLIVNPIIVVVGLLWMLAGAITWIRVGLLESRAAAAHAAEVDDS